MTDAPLLEVPLLEVNDLKKHFPIHKGVFSKVSGQVYAVDGVSFSIGRGETLGLVGESGCGKSTVGRTLLRLLEPTSGTVRIGGEDITHLDGADLLPYRRRMQMIYQDPYASLNPRMTAGEIVGEPMVVHQLGTSAERREILRPAERALVRNAAETGGRAREASLSSPAVGCVPARHAAVRDRRAWSGAHRSPRLPIGPGRPTGHSP